ncbi:MAG: hypothetical protein J0I07_30760, partial [Myxococcales bacterium]|nr:hypothetical protein [Myxococcales bacterium]
VGIAEEPSAVELARLAATLKIRSKKPTVDTRLVCGAFIPAVSAIVITKRLRLTAVVRNAVAVELSRAVAAQDAAAVGAHGVFRRALVPAFAAVVQIREEIDIAEELRGRTRSVARGTPVRRAIGPEVVFFPGDRGVSLRNDEDVSAVGRNLFADTNRLRTTRRSGSGYTKKQNRAYRSGLAIQSINPRHGEPPTSASRRVR